MAHPTGFSRTQIILHWVTALLVALQYLLHDGIAQAFENGMETGQMTLIAPAIGHMASGTIILGLAMWRLMLRRERGVPASPEGEPDWAKKTSKAAHYGFYILLVLLPVTGAAAWGMPSGTASNAHEVLRALLFLLILGHVGAVVIHQTLWKTNLLARMRRAAD